MIISISEQSTNSGKDGIFFRPENTLDAFVLGQAMNSEFNVTAKRNEDNIEWLVIDPLKLIAFLGEAKLRNTNA